MNQIVSAEAFLPSPSGPDLNDDPRTEIRIGLLVAGLFFVVFLGWAATVRMDAATYAVGRVTVSGQRQSVQHRDGGVVQSILVKEGDRVRRGQLLLQLSSPEALGEERALTSQFISLVARKARLRSEQLGSTNMTWPAEFRSLEPRDLQEAQDAFRVNQAQLAARSSLLNVSQSVIRQQTAEVGARSTGLKSQLAAVREQERLISEELESLRALEVKGFVSKTRIRSLERAQAELRGQLGQYAATVVGSSEEAQRTRLEVAQAEKASRDKASSELSDVEAAVGDLLPKLSAARARLARTRVTAPATGRVVGLSVFTAGGVVAPGETLMEIVPERAALVLEVQIAPNDADDVRVGQLAQVRLSGVHERSLPNIEGTLTRVSADSLTDKRTGESFFPAEVTVRPHDLANVKRILGNDFELKPGMPVEILIPLRKRTALQYLLEPLTHTVWTSFRQI
ncbi:MAG TPA: HlyD family type I secretion periplasmic adaptor subunit [Allosphingosinicella sp.]|jgi:HlyD family secretion protein